MATGDNLATRWHSPPHSRPEGASGASRRSFRGGASSPNAGPHARPEGLWAKPLGRRPRVRRGEPPATTAVLSCRTMRRAPMATIGRPRSSLRRARWDSEASGRSLRLVTALSRSPAATGRLGRLPRLRELPARGRGRSRAGRGTFQSLASRTRAALPARLRR